MKSLLLTIFMAIFLSSCGGGKSGESGGDEPNPTSQFSISFPELKTHGNSLSYVVKGESNREFSTIFIYRTAACDIYSQITTASRATLIGGTTIHFATANTSYDLYYRVTNSSGELVRCTHLINYTHDNLAPNSPMGVPTGLLALNGMRTKELDVPVSMDPSFLSAGADGIRVYGNSTRTQFFGEILRESFSNSSFRIIPNVTNNLFISQVDYAGNESSLISIGVSITNDSVAPITPTLSLPTTIHTAMDIYSLVANFSGDSVRVRYRNLTTNSEDIRNGSGVLTASQITLAQNQLNQIAIHAYDDVGNESLVLNVSIHHDNIAPSAPVVHSAFASTIAIPYKGPSNIMRLTSDSDSTVTLYNASMGVLAAGSASSWSDGISFNFQYPNGANTVYAVARDLAGNASTQTTINFMADSIAPSSVILDAPTLALDGAFINYETIVIRGSTSGDAYRVSITGGVDTFYDDVATLQTGVSYKLRQNDLNVVRVTVFDVAGNESAVVELSITHDNVAPVISIGYPMHGRTVRGDGIVSGLCEDLSMTVTVGVFVDTVPCAGGVWTYTLNGTYVHDQVISINMSQPDPSGNIGYASSQVTVDNVAPVLTFDPASIPASTSNHNHIVSGTCETGLTIISSGDSLGTYTCHAGAYLAPLDVSTEGLKNVTFAIEDYARNSTTVNFDVNFDFTAPPAIVLHSDTTRFNNTAVDYTNILFRGTNSEASSSVVIARDSNATIVIGTYTTADLISGITVPLLINQLNPIYVFAVDEAGNKSIPAYVAINRRQVLSRHFVVLNSSLETTNPIGEGVDYRYTVRLNNASYDVNVGYRLRISGITAMSGNAQIVVDPASDCLTREIEAFDSCDLDFTVNYVRDPMITQTNIIHNNFITLTFPDSTTQRVTIKQVSASVQAETIAFTGGITESTNGGNLFTEFLSEAFTGNSFVTTAAFVDFNLITRATADLSKKRRFQANSTTKNYAVCSSPSTRFCANADLNVNMPETIISGLAMGDSMLDPNYGDSDIGIMFIGNTNSTDILVAGKHKNNLPTSATQESGVIFYSIPDKLPTVVKIATAGSLYMTYSYPHSGSMLQNGFVYVVGSSATESVLFRINATTKAISQVSQLALGSGYTIAGGHVIFTDSAGVLKFVNSQNNVVDEVDHTLSLGNMICNYDSYARGEVRSIEERVTHSITGTQSLIPMCDVAGTPVMYAHYSPLTGLREVISRTDGNGRNFKIKYINQPDVNNLSFGLQSTSLGQTRHFIYNIATEDFYTTTAGLDSTAHVIGSRVFMKDNNSFIEMDKEFNLVSTIENMGHSNWVLVRSLNSLFVYNKSTYSVRYYDTSYNQFLNYGSYNLGRSQMIFEGFFKGFMYFRSHTGGIHYVLDRFPLYAK